MSKRIAMLRPWGEGDEHNWQAQVDAMLASLQRMRERREPMRRDLDALNAEESRRRAGNTRPPRRSGRVCPLCRAPRTFLKLRWSVGRYSCERCSANIDDITWHPSAGTSAPRGRPSLLRA